MPPETLAVDDAPPWVPPEERDADQRVAREQLVDLSAGVLAVDDLATILARVADAPAPAYLIRGVMAEGDHGMLAAEFKAGKTWAVTDLAVSVASGTPWLGIFAIDAPGSVLLFAGEGGERKIARRFRAVCESRGIDPAGLAIRVCLRAPHLTSDAAMLLVEAEIAEHRPRLVIIDPLYLAARGARGSDLYEMGAHLEGAQAICQRYGSALLIVHHWNKTGEGRGAKRMSGAGPDAWGRVLISAAVISRQTDPVSLATTVNLELDFQGDEIAERTVKIRRRVWADDPEDLTSALHYSVEALGLGDTDHDADLAGLTPAAVRVVAVLGSEWQSTHQIGDALARDKSGGPPLKLVTIQKALRDLGCVGMAEKTPGALPNSHQWRSSRTHHVRTEVENDF
ncbi:MAG: AAA family ATPase [Acidimicrobiales bacterium]